MDEGTGLYSTGRALDCGRRDMEQDPPSRVTSRRQQRQTMYGTMPIHGLATSPPACPLCISFKTIRPSVIQLSQLRSSLPPSPPASRKVAPLIGASRHRGMFSPVRRLNTSSRRQCLTRRRLHEVVMVSGQAEMIEPLSRRVDHDDETRRSRDRLTTIDKKTETTLKLLGERTDEFGTVFCHYHVHATASSQTTAGEST